MAEKKDKNWKRRLRIRTSGICVYCKVNKANQMIQLKCGTSNGAPSRRWMCTVCILKRRLIGVLKPERNMYVRVK